MKQYHKLLGHPATKLRKALCSPAVSNFNIKMKRQMIEFSPYLNPVLASCHEIIVQKRQFSLSFLDCPLQTCIFCGRLEKVSAGIFQLHLLMVLKHF